MRHKWKITRRHGKIIKTCERCGLSGTLNILKKLNRMTGGVKCEHPQSPDSGKG